MHTITELFGEPGTGKTHAAHSGWPDPLHLDTAFVQMGFRSIDVRDQQDRGESWPVVAKQYGWDTDVARDHYQFIGDYGDLFTAVEDADRETIVIDNTADLRALAAQHYCDENDQQWPSKEEWGAVNDLVDEAIQAAADGNHLVLVSQMDDEYVNGEKTGNREWSGPKRLPYKCDWRLEIVVADGSRHAYVRKNRFLDPAGDEWVADMGGSVSLEDLLLVSQIPDSEWTGVEL